MSFRWPDQVVRFADDKAVLLAYFRGSESPFLCGKESTLPGRRFMSRTVRTAVTFWPQTSIITTPSAAIKRSLAASWKRYQPACDALTDSHRV